MRIALRFTLLLAIGSYVACGFGIYADDGSANPSPDYWGWQCADGSPASFDGGCLPLDCDDNSAPSVPDGGDADAGSPCVCDDGTQVLACTCAGDCPASDN